MTDVLFGTIWVYIKHPPGLKVDLHGFSHISGVVKCLILGILDITL